MAWSSVLLLPTGGSAKLMVHSSGPKSLHARAASFTVSKPALCKISSCAIRLLNLLLSSTGGALLSIASTTIAIISSFVQSSFMPSAIASNLDFATLICACFFA